MRFALAVLACALAVANAQFNRFQNSNFGFGNNRYQGNQGAYNPGRNVYTPSTSSYPRPVPSKASAFASVVPVAPPVAPAVRVVSPASAPVAAAKVASDARSAETVRFDNDINPDGSYNYYFETNNGIAAQAQGTPRDFGGNPPVIPDVVQGSFSWVAPEGKSIVVTYVADENGYRPESDALPVPPPIPEQIRRALEYTGQLNKN